MISFTAFKFRKSEILFVLISVKEIKLLEVLFSG